MPQVKEGLYYTPEHEWLEVKGRFAYLGLTDYAQKKLGVILFADGEPEGSELTAGDVAGVVESVRESADLVTPVSGVITAFNGKLSDTPEALNDHPYDFWLVELALSDPGELSDLMSAREYDAYCSGL